MEYLISESTMAEIENMFTYHRPHGDQPQRYEALREKAKEMAILIHKSCMPSRERSLAITQLQLSVMCANAAIALNEKYVHVSEVGTFPETGGKA